jgi:hypothetical protein
MTQIVQIRISTAKLLKDNFQIDPKITESMFNKGILANQGCRDALIRNEYKQKVEPGEKQRLRSRLAEKYCISISLVEKIVLRNT